MVQILRILYISIPCFLRCSLIIPYPCVQSDMCKTPREIRFKEAEDRRQNTEDRRNKVKINGKNSIYCCPLYEIRDTNDERHHNFFSKNLRFALDFLPLIFGLKITMVQKCSKSMTFYEFLLKKRAFLLKNDKKMRKTRALK